jgi:hypothetical protein
MKVDETTSNIVGSGRTELLYAVGESIFGRYGSVLVGNGWSCFPQEREGNRRPGRVYGQTIKWSEEHDLANKLPTPKALADWEAFCAPLNVAVVFGPASGHTFAIDIDVLDKAMSREIVGIAEDILGVTPFMREGREPKIALIYRHSPEDTGSITNKSWKFSSPDVEGVASEHGLEILAQGKLLTFFGRHHVTGNYFKWLDLLNGNPLFSRPEDVPLVSAERVETFITAVDARFRFHRAPSFSTSAVSWQWDEETKLHVPKMALAAGAPPWSENKEGKVTDGREAYLSSLVFSTVMDNASAVAVAIAGGKDAVKDIVGEITRVVCKQFENTAEMSGRWRLSSLRDEAVGKVRHLISKVEQGRLALRENPKKIAKPMVLPKHKKRDPELAFIPEARIGRLAGEFIPPTSPKLAKELAIPDDRTEISTMVQQGLHKAFKSFLTDVYGAEEGLGPNQRARVHILKAPTGAGKTAGCIRTLAQDPRTKEPVEILDPETGRRRMAQVPFLMLLPTYNNIDELRSRAEVLNLDGSKSDEDLRAQAKEKGLIAEDELDAKITELRRDALDCGLTTMVFSGKIRAGCKMVEKVMMAMRAGVGTSSFCKATIRGNKDKGEEPKEELCKYYHGCPAITQRNEIAKAHVVFLPHSFMSLSIPDELKMARAVIADERIHHLFLHMAVFSATTLAIPRKAPKLTRREKETDSLSPSDILADRDIAADIALDALRLGQCPAEALLDLKSNEGEEIGSAGAQLIKSAIRVCGNALQRDGLLHPGMSEDDVRSHCARPTGRDVREEWQFWKIIQERLMSLTQDRLRYNAIRQTEEDLEQFSGEYDLDRRLRLEKTLARLRAKPDLACGSHDHRIQYLTDAKENGATDEIIRISWRTQPNWAGIPVLLLDASAAPPIIAKIWNMPESDIVVHDIVADTGKSLNVKIVGIVNQTFSNSSQLTSPGASPKAKRDAAKILAKVRQSISYVSALYGHGRVVAGTSIALRELINTGWACPDNVDWCHYGAMRGLDMFKHHSAAISIGRMEIPVRSIDGLVAALTYDDTDPEKPFDIHGNGLDSLGKALRVGEGSQNLRMRDGGIAKIPVPIYEGKWARLIQRQYREEELLQFVGRLRPVYREGRTPVWFALSSVIPEELIVDELVHIDDLINRRSTFLWDAVRRCNGVLEAGIASASCPDLFPSGMETVVKAMEAAGFGLKDGTPRERAATGFASYAWSGGGRQGIVFVRGGANDGEARIREIFTSVEGINELILVPKWQPNAGSAALARPRQPDSVEQRIGPLTLRVQREHALMDRVGEALLNSEGVIEGGVGAPKSYAYGSKGDGTMQPWQMDAYFAIEDHWKIKSGTADDRLMPVPAGDDPADPLSPLYEHFGEVFRDENTEAAI